LIEDRFLRNEMSVVDDILNGPAGVSLAMGLAKTFPPGAGHWLADQLGKRFAGNTYLDQVRAVRANQSVVGGGHLSELDLERVTQNTFRSAARSLYDYYHFVENPQKTLKMVEFTPAFGRCIVQKIGRAHV
jgi:hypothetical protein